MRLAVFHNLNSGGSLRALKYQVRYLKKFGHSVKIYSLTTPGFTRPWDYLIYLFFQLPSLHKRLASTIDSSRPDVCLVAHDHLTQSPYLLRFLKTPTVYYCNEPKRDLWEKAGFETTTVKDSITRLLHFPLKFIDPENAGYATLMLANSRYSKQVLERIYRRPVQLNYLGVDTQRFAPPHPNSNHRPEKPTVLSVGTFLPHKGFDFLIKSVSLIPVPRRPLLVLAGNGGSPSYILYLKSLSRSLSVNLTIHQFIPDVKLIELYQKSAVFAAPFHNEPFGLAVLEALACGTPAVVVNEGGLPEFAVPPHRRPVSETLPPVTIVPRDTRLFSSAILKLLTLSSPRYTRLSRASRMAGVDWSWPNSIRQLESCLANIAGKS